MKFTLLSTLLLACSSSLALAVPVPAPAAAASTTKLQSQIQKLQVTIHNVISDITHHGGATMHNDYHSGADQFKQIFSSLAGKKLCGRLPASQAKSEKAVIDSLATSWSSLGVLKTELGWSNPPDSDAVHKDVCGAYQEYQSVHPYIKSL